MPQFKKYLIAMISIGLLGEIYFYPFHGGFRFTVGVIAFSLVLLVIHELKEIQLSIFVGLFILLLRSTIHGFLDIGDVGLIHLIYANLPGAFYYIIYGILFYFLNVRRNKDHPYMVIISLFSIDVLSNVIELILRKELTYQYFGYNLMIGLIRSIITYFIFSIIERKEAQAKKNEYRKRYIQLNILVSNIQAEMFYLKKSAKDIEEVMSKSYSLYSENKDNDQISGKALDIAREVHEIKKDYYRALDGFDSFLKDFESNEGMNLKDIKYIIESNTRRYMKSKDKEIDFSMTFEEDVYINQYYDIFTIVNNLITNSIDAIKEKGYIKVEGRVQDNTMIISVLDNGEGIEKDNLPYIYTPGFTTKFDEKSGYASTGIGLSHIKNIIQRLNGDIEVKSEGKNTQFKISIPMVSLRRKAR